MKSVLLATLALAPLVAALPAAAQTSDAAPAPSRVSDPHRSDDIIVTAPLRQSEADVLQGTSVLTGEELTRQLRPTIGETLARLPGVSASSFGPNASRPILRGFQGDRIRVLTDGIGSIDVSNTSVDHAVIIDPLLAERVEVLRGPAALLYGSSAVGGVVNVVDTRIPRRLPDNGYRLDAIGTYGSAANERSVGGAADATVAGPLVLHVDGSYLKSDDLRTGGYILSREARRAALASAALPADPDDPIDFAANAALRGKLPNSAAETWTAGAGASIITDGGMLGVSYGHYDSLYGVPVRYATAPGQEQEAPRLDVVQNRYDLRAEVTPQGSVIEAIRLRAAHASYRHFELEEDGAVGTAFYNKGLEGRLEVVQAKRGGWQGASGAQYFSRAFNVVGDEAFLPRNNTEQTGLFTLQQYDNGRFKAEGGVRYEHTLQTAQPSGADRFFTGQRTFDSWSGSIGGSYAFSDGFRLGLNGSRTGRAPSAEELFANGPHAGTQAYELGNPDFRTETSWGIEATLHAHSDVFSLDASAYYNWFDNYIYEAQVDPATCVTAAGGDIELPCFQYQQAKARYYGFEADASARLGTIGTHTITADLMGDYVHANVVDRGPVPRIPPLRLLGGLEARGDTTTGRVEVERAFPQTRLSAFETRTDGYTMVNASLAWKPWGGSDRRSLLLSANNIFDVEARRHSSVLKDFAPLAGRDIRVTLRMGI
ncbi:TonB-dependent receptor [Sphingomonas ginsenosidimutans]|jgi:iron complex outermembrane receptor protein|uniref:TonB-dependent receptor n=1 Tax=Sphingomonas ginsenosidimutans TaxID=862134 RepID=A0A2A4HYW9_9SPHN|nr:TonB-dependent receptor [Sphingomonas ginsenosidimutans]PCG08867.1 TonB-dependent receptor [Sphingomonas ginsenosidimutans]